MGWDEAAKVGVGAGVFIKLKAMLEHNRLGDLLVLQGLLTPQDLRYALAHQKISNNQLGRVLLERRMLSRRALYGTLAQQWTLRMVAAFFTIGILIASSKSARANTIKDIPAQVKLVSAAQSSIGSMNSYPALFGAEEKRSGNIKPFTKWSAMFTRFEQAVEQPANQNTLKTWQAKLQGMQGLALPEMARAVNTMVNATRYIGDDVNWGQTDYWGTPLEFFARGGDCEDFAIAKYASLRALGVPESRMRIAIVQDTQKNIPHAVLVVYTDHDALVLDNQSPLVKTSAEARQYRPIFSINRTGWWLHTTPKTTVLASVN